MIAIRDNLEMVLAELKAFEQAVATQVLPAVLQPAEYLPALAGLAREILSRHLPADKVERYLATISGRAFRGGMSFTLGGVWLTAVPLPEEPLSQDDYDTYRELALDHLDQLLDDITAWVEQEKNKTSERDYYVKGGPIPDEKIAARLAAILRQQPDIKFNALLKYLAGKRPDVFAVTDDSNLESVTLALVDVLDAWEAQVGHRLVLETHLELEAAWQRKLA